MKRHQVERLIIEAEELLFRLESLYKAYDVLVGEEEEERPPRRSPQPTTPKIPQKPMPKARWAPLSRMLPAPEGPDALEEWILRGPIAADPWEKKPPTKKNKTKRRLTDIFPPGFLPEEYYEDDEDF